MALVGLGGDLETELRAGDGRRARGQDAGTRSAASSATPGLAAAPRGATNSTPQSGESGLVAPTPHLVVTGFVLLLQCGFDQLHPQGPTRVSPSLLLLPGGFG